MRHTEHILKNKNDLESRSQIIRLMRDFFWSQDFTEVETPLLVRLPGQEPNLSPMPVSFHNEKNILYSGYLHTSPEYAMKKMLAAGFTKIFSICKCFRDHESFGGLHNPEFTMIEWYRTQADFTKIMDDIDGLLRYLISHLSFKIPSLLANFEKCERIHMRDLWQKYIGINLDSYLDRSSLYQLCLEKKYNVKKDEKYEELFYRIFLNEIEPHLGEKNPTIVHHYPGPMAALAKLSDTEPGYAERFELYLNGIELANAFSELTNSEEQLTRLEQEQKERQKMKKDTYDIDKEFIKAVALMPPSAGIALGVDRLIQIFTGCKNIDDVLVLPASILFN
jgi:lysyl-tRNA synthetase class 2